MEIGIGDVNGVNNVDGVNGVTDADSVNDLTGVDGVNGVSGVDDDVRDVNGVEGDTASPVVHTHLNGTNNNLSSHKTIRSRSKSPRRTDSNSSTRGDRDERGVSPALGRTMRQEISVDLEKYADKDDVKWMVWLAETDISQVGQCQENHSTAQFLTMLEKKYGQLNTVKCLEILLGCIGKAEIAEKVAEIRGASKWRRESTERFTMTIKLKATIPDLMKRRGDIENDLRDLLDDDNSEIFWDCVTFGAATIKFKLPEKFREKVEMLVEESELRELGGLTILKLRIADEEIQTLTPPDANQATGIPISVKYDTKKHQQEARLLGVILQQNGIEVLDPLVRQLQVWEEGSFQDSFIPPEQLDSVKYQLVCVDDVEDSEHIDGFNPQNVPVVLISFDKVNTETVSSRMIYHLPWMNSMLLEKLKRRPPPPLKPKIEVLSPPIPAIVIQEEPSLEEENEEDLIQEEEDLQEEILLEEEHLVSSAPLVEGALDEAFVLEEEEPLRESSPVVEEEPIRESSPIVEEEPIRESSPVVEEEPLRESTPPEDSQDTSTEDPNAAVEVAEEMIVEDMQKIVASENVGQSEADGATKTDAKISDEDSDNSDVLNWTMHKVILIGDSAVGKTSILTRFSDHNFSNNFISTVGIDFKVKKVKRDKRKVKLQIWDTAGQERYRTITAAFYRGTSAFLVVFDVTQMSTFVNVRTWLNQITANTDKDSHVIVLVGNKGDLEDHRQVPKETAQQLADELGVRYFETSAKSGDNVTEVFHHVADVLPTQDEEDPFPQSPQTVSLDDNQMQQSKCRC